MKTEQVTRRCPKCQASLPPNAPEGLCPKCLLAAVAAHTDPGQAVDKGPPPDIGAVAAAFPQLEIIELIGQGGMGLVYKARQPKLERWVALKLLPQALGTNPMFAERFNREARVLARLSHPNIVTVHDFGQAGGFFYLVMEYVDGVNLRQAMHAGRFTPQQAMLLVPRICEALQFAHDEGILHRDIKPENILLDTRGRVKIADFGIAKLVGEAREQLALTASGMAVGTPHYMAPEQLERPNDVDQRADIYSLGVVFYEMLTGELPIGRFAPPSQKAAVDPRVDEVVFRALEKEREKRFRTATEVKSSVEALTSTVAVSTAPSAGGPANPGSANNPAAPETRSACYFNTPQKMADCFPSAAARVFTCKGELVLKAERLVFTSPWSTTLDIALRNIEDLTVGQFQMWTTPWVMKYARVNFLAVTFRKEGKPQTIHLTPVPPEARSANEINLHVGRWCERLREAIQQCTGRPPHTSDPEWLAISAEPAWNRKGLPLTYGFALMFLAAWILLPQRSVPAPIGLSVLVLSSFLLIASMWFCFGFLQANRALSRGRLDAVTSEEPPRPELAAEGGPTPPPRRRFRRLSPYLSLLAAIGAGVAVPLGMLLWQIWLYPSFAELFGKRHAEASESKLVLDAVPSVFQESSRDPRTFGGQVWHFQCLLPPNHLAQFVFIHRSNGVPSLDAGMSAYFKTGHVPVGKEVFISAEPQAEAGSNQTNAFMWNVNWALGFTTARLLPAEQPFRFGDTPARMSVHSGHQRVISLLQNPAPRAGSKEREADVELRLLVQPLKGPAMRTVPSEKELGDSIGGSGFEMPESELLKLIKQLPSDT